MKKKLLGERYLDISTESQRGLKIKDNLVVFPINGVDIGLERCQEMLEDLELNVSFMVSKSDIWMRLENNGSQHKLDWVVLQLLANLGWEIVNVSPLRWNCNSI